ncbi:MAG: protein kinase domain-containing protein [Pyrinomonadaceae bacterium]
MPNEFEPNALVSHYRIISRIGVGGMGEVYLAEDTKLGRKVAIKFLDEECSRDSDKLKRFVQEAKAASALNHPNILTVYEIGEADGKHFISTELIEGQNLREHILSGESMPLKTVLKVIFQVAEALAAAHSAGIIHRDIKPENIMIRKDGYAKIVDFGLTKLAETDALTHNIGRDQMLTSPGMIVGTLFYMSPEQARGSEVDFRTDIFSLGVVFYELITNRHPFAGETNGHTIVAIIDKPPPPLIEFGYRVPVELERIMLRALEKKAGERYQSAKEMAADIKMLRKRIEFEAELERTSPPDHLSENTTRAFPTGSFGQPRHANAIAVMPFVNMSPSEDGDYFSDGIAEELLNVLSKIRGLRVAARTSAFSFKGKQTTIAEIGRALNVGAVLEGSIRTSGNRARIAVQLVNVADGYQLWSETYDRKMDDIFAVQDDIAGTVVEELRAMLVGEDFDAAPGPEVMAEVAEAVKGRAANAEAQRLMLLGRHFLDRTTKEDTTKAIGYFREALDLDPEFALCWAELGRAFSIEAGKAWGSLDERYANSRKAAERALVLEPDLAEGHALLGRIRSAYDMDLKGALVSYENALELAPGNSLVMDGASILKLKLGRFHEAVRLSRRVVAQDPLSGAIWHNLGFICHAGDFLEESAIAFRKALELGPNRMLSAAMLALVLLEQGLFEDALATADAEPDAFWKLWANAIIFHKMGRVENADAALAELIELHTKSDAYQIAEIYSMRGELDEAFRWLESAFDVRDPGITHTKVDPRFRPLHDDPRWPALLDRIGFEI